MDLRRLGDPLLKPRPSPIFSFLLPSFHSSRRAMTTCRKARIVPTKPPRYLKCKFHSSSIHRAQSSSSAADLDELEDLPQSNHSGPSPTTSPQQRASDNQIDALLESTFNKPYSSRRKPYTPPKETSASMLDAGHKAAEYYSMRERGARSPGSLARSMAFPSPQETNTARESKYLRNNDQQIQLKPKRAMRTIRSRPTVGRTVEINPDRDVDFGRALRTLGIQCAVNRVRADLQRQRYHERPGMKRKRLKSERWRKLFRESFRATVGRVKEMRRKGW